VQDQEQVQEFIYHAFMQSSSHARIIG